MRNLLKIKPYLLVLIFAIPVLSPGLLAAEECDLSATGKISRLERKNGSKSFLVEVLLETGKGCYTYADDLDIEVESGRSLEIENIEHPEPVVRYDKFSGDKRKFYAGSNLFKIFLLLPEDEHLGNTGKIKVSYRSRSESTVFMPRFIIMGMNPTQGENAQDSMGSAAKVDELFRKGFWLALLAAFITGVLSSLTPCVYPIIPVVVSVVASKASNRRLRGLLLSSVFVLGLSVVYSGLGILSASSGTFLGSYLQSPWAFIVVSVIFFSMGLSLIGLFEIKLPGFVSKLIARKPGTRDDIYIGIFVTGMVTGVIAIPCIGPFALSVLTFAVKTQSLLQGFFLLFAFSLGIGVLFIVLGSFSFAVASLPRPGLWMVIVKKIFGLILVGASIYYMRVVIPVWHFPLLLSLILFALAFAFKIAPHHDSKTIERVQGWIARLAIALGLLTLLLFTVFLDLHKSGSLKGESPISWLASESTALEKASSEDKPVLVDFYADWCPGCQDMESSTFRDEKIINKSKEFVMLRIDLTKATTEGQRVVEKYAVLGLPTLVFLDSEGRAIDGYLIAGYINRRELLRKMDEVLENAGRSDR